MKSRLVILLDWDGPISNSRTWSMCGQIDPVAVKMVNDIVDAGGELVLTSTIRKDMDYEEATQRLTAVGFNVKWFAHKGKIVWRTNPFFTDYREVEFLNWLVEEDIADSSSPINFVAIDDEVYSMDVRHKHRVFQPWPCSSSEGLSSRAISQCYRWLTALKTGEEA